MENLPIELLDVLLYGCGVEDILNLACCSKNLYALLKPILWRSVKIRLSSLTTKVGSFVQNLKHTSYLSIVETSHSDGQEAQTSFAGCQAVNIGLNLAHLISYCIPAKVVNLHTDLNDWGLEYVLERLCHVKILILVTKGGVDAKVLNKLRDLEELCIWSNLGNSLITNEASITGEKLRKVEIFFKKPLNDNALMPIGKLTSLEHLVIANKGEETLLGIRPLSTLTNLKFLDLYNLALNDDGVKQLCQCLRNLRSLGIQSCRLTDDALSEVHCLEFLTHLDLSYCIGLTPRCFSHLISVSLLSIAFCADICPVSRDTTFVNSDVTRLNKLSTLKKVLVNIERSSSHRKSLAVIANSLCANETWKMDFNSDICAMQSTFTRDSCRVLE